MSCKWLTKFLSSKSEEKFNSLAGMKFEKICHLWAHFAVLMQFLGRKTNENYQNVTYFS
jgi:hypothetical protein